MPTRVWLFVVAMFGGAGLLAGLFFGANLGEKGRPQESKTAPVPAALQAAGATVASPAPAAEIRAAAAPLAPQIARVQQAVPSARVADVVTWQAEPIQVPPAVASGPAPCDGSTGGQTITPRGTVARLETTGGVSALVGEVELWRGDTLLGRSPWRVDATRWLTPPAPILAGWGVGGVASLSIDRAAVGVLVSPPPRGRREILLGAGVEQFRGGRGAWVSVSILFRRPR